MVAHTLHYNIVSGLSLLMVNCPMQVSHLKTQCSPEWDVAVKEFDVGYYEGTTVVGIRSPRDLTEAWNDLKAGKKVILWCDEMVVRIRRESKWRLIQKSRMMKRLTSKRDLAIRNVSIKSKIKARKNCV